MMVCLCLAAGAANTFTAVSGDWNVPGNWSEGIVPTNGETVVINGNATLTNSTGALASLAVAAGKTLAFDGWDTVLTATTVSITGTVTHAQNTATTTNSLGQWVPNARVNIACDTLTIPLGGKIDVAAKGFLGGMASTTPGKGPGGGTHRVGGGHGGRGGRPDLTSSTGITYGAGGLAYDSYATPEQPGSGGGGGDTTRAGGNGGGAVRIAATGNVLVDGAILAYGGPGVPNHGAGGGGGSVFISCSTVSGSGVISAYGGVGQNNTGGGGGGGCIAIDYDPVAQGALPLPGVEINAAGGNASYNPSRSGSVSQLGEPGTLDFPDNQLLTRVTAADVVKISGRWMDAAFTEWDLDALTLQNAWLSFPQSGFRLTVTNNLAIKGTDSRIHRLDTTNAVLTIGGTLALSKASYVMCNGLEAGASLVVGGDLSLTNASSLYVYAPPPTVSKPDYTAFIDVAGTFTIAAGTGTGLTGGSWVYPHSDSYNGGTALFDVGSLRITTANAGFDANVKGYYGGLKNAIGYGPGGGNANVGGGHGGSGGFSATKGGGLVNDSAQNPVLPGSGGGGGDGSIPPIDAGRGGGAVRIESAGSVLVNGSILANGGNGFGNHGGGGAGGTISIGCTTFRGTNGVISAIGGNGNNVNGGGGGGGRISVRYASAAQAADPVPRVVMSAQGGTATVIQYSGEPGSLYFPDTQVLLQDGNFLTSSGALTIPGFTSWGVDRLVVSNALVALPDDFVLTVTNDLVLSGTSPTAHKLVASGGAINCGSLRMDKSVGFEMHGGIVTNSALPGAEVNVDGEMFIGPNAWVYPYSHPTNGGSVRFTVDNLTVNATGGFNANGKGYMGGSNGSSGFGPGGGLTSTATNDRGGGGGYGAQGMTFSNAIGGYPYGSASTPTLPGSGGGSEPRKPLEKLGGDGGGLVWVDAAGDVLMNGTINANGGEAGGNSGAGSGGGVYLRCATFAGAGAITANGGSSYVGGGGGRIAVVYTDLTAQALLSPAVRFNATSTLSQGTRGFDQGSLYFPDTTFFPYPTISGSYNIAIPTMVPTWNGSSLVVTNGEVHFPLGASLNLSGDLAIGKGGVVVFTNNPVVACGGDLAITNGGIAHFYAEATNGVSPAYGAKVEVGGKLIVGAASTANVYSDRYTGGSVYFEVKELRVSATGKIDANGRGFSGGVGTQNGYGPGRGIFKGWPSDRGGAGGYGGRGATSSYTVEAKGGPAYGEVNAPRLCGSGGAGKAGATGGFGGGLLWMRIINAAVVDGVVSANGTAPSSLCGDGSGGGIFLDCGSFSGSGAISANGGMIAGTSGAHGGGGRVAVWQGVPDYYRAKYLDGKFGGAVVTNLPPATFTGTATAACGTIGWATEKAEPGTVVFLTAPPLATTILVR